MVRSTNRFVPGAWRWIAGLLLLGTLLPGCRRREPVPAAEAPHARDLARGAAFAERLASRQDSAADSMTEQEVIAAGYLERLRLGLGSPFRLMEHALRDPRLVPRTRTPLLWALLDATRAGRAYEVDPRALVPVAGDARDRDPELGGMHLALIEEAVAAAGDPRAGEVAVREAYRLAAASHAVSPTAPAIAASAAALARDRALARGDAERLLARAGAAGRHPFALLAEWRQQRRFQVEAPPAAPRALAVDGAAATQALPLVGRIEEIGPRFRTGGRSPERAGAPRLAAAAGRRLARGTKPDWYPTQAPVWITVQRYDDDLRRITAGDARAAGMVQRLLRGARTEETFAAEYAALAAAPAAVRQRTALIALEAAVAMRAYNQEGVWFPGFPAPSEADLKRVYGIRGVEFDAAVPEPWRPYYRRMLGDALADLELVLPSLDLRDAGFAIGTTGRTGAAVAIHDPYGRTIVLPPESGAGAIAHEVGHDLDWQVAYARYGMRAAYASEHVVRSGRGDDFASAVRRMPVPPEVAMRGGPEVQRRYAQRPPEIFARTFDGYVVGALAVRGRSNGYLSAAQDEFLGGYGLALMPGARTDAAAPFMEMLMVASPVPEPARRDFMGRWGPGRPQTGFDLAGRMASGTAPRPSLAERPAPGMAEVMAARGQVRAEADSVLALRDRLLAEWWAARCPSPLAGWDPHAERLLDAAASARIRGVVLAHARRLGFEDAPAWLRDVWLGPAPQPRVLPDTPAAAAKSVAAAPRACGIRL